MVRLHHQPLLTAFAAIWFAAACAGAPVGSPAPPSSTPPPTDGPPTSVSSAAHAAVLVLATNPAFSGVAPLNPQLVGQCCWYEALETGDGFEVTVEVGWGDCLAGCIDRHRWVFEVSRDGDVVLIDESGSNVDDLPPETRVGPGRLLIQLVAAPVCPVESNPPDPACAPRPVADAEVSVRNEAGAVVAVATADEGGVVDLELDYGPYYLEAAAVDGLLGRPEPVAFALPPETELHITLTYDTGIR